ncbi:unnamed protein product [Calypogeia fissa]
MAKSGGDGKERDVVLITGCSDGGIGAALAVEFAKAGFSVVATSRSVNTMKALSSNENIHPRTLDVTDYEGAKATVERVVAEFGHIDILINNAGMPCVAPVAEMPISYLESTFKTNVFGPVVLVNAVVPHMVARGKGRIVNVGSVASLCYGPWAGGYVSSKAALEALTDALRLELRPFGIEVVLIMPGAIVSNFGEQSVSGTRSDVLQGLKIYKSFEQHLIQRGMASQSPKSTPTDVFARKVVSQVLAKSPPAHFAYGHLSTLFSILFYTPFWLRDFLWAKHFKLDGKVTNFIDKKSD